MYKAFISVTFTVNILARSGNSYLEALIVLLVLVLVTSLKLEIYSLLK